MCDVACCDVGGPKSVPPRTRRRSRVRRMLRGQVNPRASGLRVEATSRRSAARRSGSSGEPRPEAQEQARARTTAQARPAQHSQAAAAAVVESAVGRRRAGEKENISPPSGRRTSHADPAQLNSDASLATVARLNEAWRGEPANAGGPAHLDDPDTMGPADSGATPAVRRVQRSSTQSLPVRGQRLRVRLQRRPPAESLARGAASPSNEVRFQGQSSGSPPRTVDRRNEPSQNVGQYTVDTQSDLLTREEETLLVTRAQAGIALEHAAEALAKQLGHYPTVEELASHTGLPAATVQERLALGNQAKHLMVKHNLRLVISVARRYAYRGLELSDLIQEGAVGLIRGIQRFDPSKGYKFSTYSHWWIRQSVSRAVVDQGRTVRLPAHIVEMLTRMRRAEQVVKQQGQPDESTAVRVGALLGVTPDRVRELLVMSRDVSSMDAETTSHSSKDSRRSTLSDSVAASPVALEEEYDSQFLADDLNTVLNTLEPRERNVLRMHFGLMGNGRAMTLVDVGTTYGLSRERVRQIEDIAFRKLRSPQRCKTLLRHVESSQYGRGV